MSEIDFGILEKLRALTPFLEAKIVEIETHRSLPAEVVEALKDAGVFRMFAPSRVGGLELDLPTGVQTLTYLSSIDGSIGWNAAIGAGAHMLTPLLSHRLFESLYSSGPDVIIAGATQPLGRAIKVDGGYEVSGRWPFASGCRNADWIVGTCTLDSSPSENPQPRMFILPAPEWQIEDTWYRLGLRGTGSHHVSLDRAPVPEENFLSENGEESAANGPLYKDAPKFFPLFHGAVNLGIAQAAFNDFLKHVQAAKSSRSAKFESAESLLAQQIGRVSARLHSLEASLTNAANRLWNDSNRSADKPSLGVTTSLPAALEVADAAVQIVSSCYELTGSAAIYDTSPLQRRLRDIYTATQHGVVQRLNFAKAGSQLLNVGGKV